MNLIVCIDKDNGIGYDGKLLFHIKEDMKRFKDLTMGKTVIMGMGTYESIGNPLPGRKNIVLTRRPFKSNSSDLEFVSDIESWIKDRDLTDLFVIGGESVYKKLLPYCDIAYVTQVEAKKKHDRRFPKFPENWFLFHETALQYDEKENLSYKFMTFKKGV